MTEPRPLRPEFYLNRWLRYRWNSNGCGLRSRAASPVHRHHARGSQLAAPRRYSSVSAEGVRDLNTGGGSHGGEKHSLSPPCFSAASLQVLLQAVEERREILFSPDGRRRPSKVRKRAWLEVAEEVSSRGVVRHTWIQCRKRLNDPLRSAREKRAHNARERSRTGGGVACPAFLSRMEDDALMIAGEEGGRAVEDGEAGGHGHETGDQLHGTGSVSVVLPSTSEVEEGAPSHPRDAPSTSADRHPGWDLRVRGFDFTSRCQHSTGARPSTRGRIGRCLTQSKECGRPGQCRVAS
ncbi:uncharacterized protein [Heterodontus francisci]|uniref:uncharacterized protein n=1 Tax=Heterodontus francisci TaxID=7792 RepID=UPI00355B5E15